MKMKIMKTALCAFMLFVSTQLLMPSAMYGQKENSIEKPVLYVHYLKDQDGFHWFKVTITQPEERKAILKIQDKSRETLYSEFINDENYCRTYKFPKEDAGTIEFSFHDGKELLKKLFEIGTRTEEISFVNEIKSKK